MDTYTSEPMGNADSILKMISSAFRKAQKNLVLSTTYGLNTSNSKKVVIGLGLCKNEKFAPVIKLENNSGSGICLTVGDWVRLTDELEHISEYLDNDGYSDAQWYCNHILLDECKVIFTTSHSSRSIIFETTGGPDVAGGDGFGGGDEKCDDSNKRKRSKQYRPAIVMQKPTYDGLKSVFVCVDEQLRRLQRLERSVNLCKQLYVEYVVEKVKIQSLREPSLHRISQIASRESESAKEHIKLQLEQEFIKHYFDIVLLEITKLFNQYITVEVKRRVEAEPSTSL